MKKDIHPKYVDCKVTCGCGNSWMTRSTVASLAVEVCSNCHPFFTGQQKFIDTAGRVEKFQRKYAWDARQAVTRAEEAAREAAVAAKAAAKPRRRPPIATKLHTTAGRPKAVPKTAEAVAKADAAAGRPGGRPARGGRGPKKEAPPSTERKRVGKPKPEEPPAQSASAETPPPEPAPPSPPKAESPKTGE